MRKLLSSSLIIGFLYVLSSLIAPTYAKPNWSTWVKELRQEAITQGISPALFDQVFMGLHPNRRVINLDRSQPERRLTFLKYRRTRIDPFRIKLGRREYKRYHALLTTVAKQYGVDPCFIVALWGIESSYGRYMGNFPVIKSLATLAYDDRRGQFFRKELLYALQILNGGHIENRNFKGEWAGASGQPQFLPSNWYKYAIDYDQDGKKDIWKTHGDIFASIANYLTQHGWQAHQPWAIEVTLPAGFNKNLIGLKVKKPVAAWWALGVHAKTSKPLPRDDLMASIVKPYGGPAFMVFKNYRVLLRYNNSIFYAGSVGYLADKICGR